MCIFQHLLKGLIGLKLNLFAFFGEPGVCEVPMGKWQRMMIKFKKFSGLRKQ